MKTGTKINFLMLSLALAGFMLLSQGSFAQLKPGGKGEGKKTVTVRITTETDGKVVKIDTTFVTEGNFDEDAFLTEKKVLKEAQEQGTATEKQVIIRRSGPKEVTYTDSDGNSPDTIIINDGRIIIFNDKNERPDMQIRTPHTGMPNEFNMAYGFPPMQGPGFEHMMQGMMRSMGLDNMMPFGELDNIVVKKKHNGKKVIISFKDCDKACCGHKCGDNRQEKVLIYKNDEQGMAPQNEERYVIDGDNGEKIIILKNVETNGNEKTVTIKADVDKSAPEKQEKKVIIIKKEDIK